MRKDNSIMAQMRDKAGTWGHLNPDRLRYVWKHAHHSVLDIGCATGDYVRLLNQKGYDAKGCDLMAYPEWDSSPPKLFSVEDITHLRYRDMTVETALVFEVLEHVSDLSAACAELQRVASQNVLISVPNCENYELLRYSGLNFNHYTDRTHVNFFTVDSLTTMLTKEGFQVKEVVPINPIYPEIVGLGLYGVPVGIAKRVAKWANKLPFKKKLFMTLLAVCDIG